MHDSFLINAAQNSHSTLTNETLTNTAHSLMLVLESAMLVILFVIIGSHTLAPAMLAHLFKDRDQELFYSYLWCKVYQNLVAVVHSSMDEGHCLVQYC